MTKVKANKKESVMAKIKALIETSKKTNSVEEAETAMLLAQKLMAKYEIEKSEIEQQDDDESIVRVVVVEGKQIKNWEKYLGLCIAKNFKVEVFTSNGIYSRTLNFYGYEGDCELAKQMYDFAKSQMEVLSKAHVDSYYKESGIPRNVGITRKIKESFLLGFIKGLNNKYKKQREEIQEKFALAIMTPVEVKQSMTDKFGTMQKTKLKGKSVHTDSYRKGKEQGEKLVSRKGISC